MLVCEGLLYALSSVLLSLVLAVVLGPLAFSALQSMFWFFTYRFTLAPILAVAPVFALLGALVPLGGVPLHLQTHRGGAPAGVGQLTKPYNGTAPPPVRRSCPVVYLSIGPTGWGDDKKEEPGSSGSSCPSGLSHRTYGPRWW